MAQRIKFVVEFDAAAATAQLDDFKRKAAESGGSVSGGRKSKQDDSVLSVLRDKVSGDALSAMRAQVPQMFDPTITNRQKEGNLLQSLAELLGGVVGGVAGGMTAGPGGALVGWGAGSKLAGMGAEALLAVNKPSLMQDQMVQSLLARENADRLSVGMAPLQGETLRRAIAAAQWEAERQTGGALSATAGANQAMNGLMNGRATDFGNASGRDMIHQATHSLRSD